MRRKLILAFTLLFAFVMLTANAGLTEAATSRVAIISKLTGTVEVQKSGGKKTLKGFKNMSLNEGDIVSTGSKSSVELKFSNGTSTDDTLVLESDTTVTFSKLSSKNGTVTKVKMKSGKAWVDVKSISSDSDDFQLETPTAIMGVRGTNFFIGIDPNNGKSVLGMFAGVVQLQTEEDNFRNTQFVFPAQLLYTSPTEGELIGLMSNDSLEQMLQLTSPETMQAILSNLQKVKQENAQMLEQFRNNIGSNPELDAKIQEALNNEQLRTNIERIVAALLKEAVDKNLITQNEKAEKLQELFGELAGKQQDTFVGTDANNEYDFVLNQKTQQMLELLNQSNKLAERKAALENQLAEQKKKLEEEKKKREQQALEKYLSTLNDAQKNKFLQERDRVTGGSTPTPVSTPQPTNTPEPTPTSTPGWSEVAAPFIVEQQQSEGNVALSYTKLTEEKHYELNNAIQAEAGMHVEFKGANEQFQITSVSVNGEPLSSEQGRYIWYLPSAAAEFNITIGMNHPGYGEASLTLLGNVQYEDAVATAPFILQQPTDKTANVGEAAILSVTAESLDGGVLSYQWYRNSVNSNYGGQLISGANGASYAVPTGVASTGYYYVEVTNTKNSANGVLEASIFSNAVQVTVNPIVNAATPSINTQPVSVEVDQGAPATLTVAANITDSGTLSYQWYSNTTSSNSGGTMIANAASATYSAPTNVAGASYYYVVVTNTNDNVNGVQTASTTSQSAQVTVNPIVDAATPSINTQPVSVEVDKGAPVILTVAANITDSGILSYQWYSNATSSSNGGTMITGATSATYTAPTNVAGISYYYVVVTNTNNNVNGVRTASTTSQSAQVTVNPIVDAATPTINTQPVSVEVDQGASAMLTVAADITDSGILSYQWYSNTTSSNNGGTMIVNATSATYTAPTNVAGTSYYYVVVTNTNNNVNGVQTASITSQSAQVTVQPLVHAETPVIMTSPSDRVVNMGSNTTLSVEVLQAGDGGTLSFQWYSNTSDSNNGGTAINGATGQTYSAPTNAAGTSYYYVVVTNTNNSVNGVKTATADSEAAQVTVNPFVVVHNNWGEEIELDYSYEEASQAYALNEQIHFSSSAEMLVIKPPSSSYTITGVDVTDQYGGPYPLMDYNGSFQGMMPSGPFTAVISMTGAANESLQFTLQGVSNYEQPPGWEDYEPPFMLELLSNQVSTPLGYTSTGGYLSYEADEVVYVSQGDRLEIFSTDSDFTITEVRVNYESAPMDDDKYSWGLEAGWRLLNIEIDVTHNVQQSGLGSATYYLAVTTRTIPQGWETIEKPLILTLINEQSQESISINYDHDPYGYSTLVVEAPIVVTDPSKIKFDVAGQDYHIQSVSVGWEEMEGHDEYYWNLQPEYQVLNVTIELMHDQYGPQTLYMEIVVLPDPEIMPVFFNIGYPESDLSQYYNHPYSSDPDYDGVYTRVLRLGQIMVSQQGMPQDMYVEPIANPIMRLEYEQDGQWIEFSPDYEGKYFIRLNDFVTINFRMTIWNEELAEEQVYLINGMVIPYGGV